MQLIPIEEPAPIQYDLSECNNKVESDAISWVHQNTITLRKEFESILMVWKKMQRPSLRG